MLLPVVVADRWHAPRDPPGDAPHAPHSTPSPRAPPSRSLVAALADRLDPQTEATEANWAGIAETSGTVRDRAPDRARSRQIARCAQSRRCLSQVLYREIDFSNERRSAQDFERNFANMRTVKVRRTAFHRGG